MLKKLLSNPAIISCSFRLANYFLIYLSTAVGLTPGGSSTVQYSTVQYTFTHQQHNETEYNTYIKTKIHKHTIRIHKRNNKDI